MTADFWISGGNSPLGQHEVMQHLPVDFSMSTWRFDPLAGGAYMYPTVDSRPGDKLVLQEPIAERIFLAGEALDTTPGYVDTAWHDGERAAELIIGTA